MIRSRLWLPARSALRVRAMSSTPGRISTLDPALLKPEDYIVLSHRTETALFPSERLRYSTQFCKTPVPFPPNTRGFFYHHRPHPSHPASGQLRFRVVPEPDPSLFWSGHDLLAPGGTHPSQAWHVHRLFMHKQLPRMSKLYSLCAPPEEQDALNSFLASSQAAFPKTHEESWARYTVFLDHILDPFVLDFANNSLSICLLDPETVRKIFLQHIFVVQPSVWKDQPYVWDNKFNTSPYSGKALCQFELANLLHDRKSDPVPRLTIRVLEWIEKPDPATLQDSADGKTKITQEEGELLRKCDVRTGLQRVWARKVTDFIPPASLEILKETYKGNEVIAPDTLYPKFTGSLRGFQFEE